MKLKNIYAELQAGIRTVVCVIAAVLILQIAFPSFAEDSSGAGEAPGAEASVITEEVTEEAGGAADESAAEVVEEGYVTMKAVSGDPSVTD